MRGNCIGVVAGLIVTLLCALPAHAANAITAARLWPSPEYSRIALELSQAPQYKYFSLANPNRLVVDLRDVELGPVLQAIASQVGAKDPVISALRVGLNQPGVVRLVVELKSEAKARVFALAPMANYAHRLVVDLYPTGAASPIATVPTVVPAAPVLVPAAVPAAAQAPMPAATVPGAVIPVAPAVAPAQAPAIAVPATVKIPAMATGAAAPQTGAEKPVENAAARAGKPAVMEDKGVKAEKPAPAPVAKAETRPEPVVPAKAGAGGEAKAPPAPQPAAAKNQYIRLITVAIDAGHGGEDPGATGANGSQEKDITLAVARRLKDHIDKQENMRAVLVRDGDYFVPLYERVNKARRNQADLFVSIHADAFLKSTAKGSSVFALSEKGATSAAARWLAKRENDADLIGGLNIDVKDVYLKQTLISLSQDAQIRDSLILGRAVLDELGGINNLHRGHVEQAGFAVLKAPDIPSILVETAFISNPDEEKRLLDEEYQDRMADAIVTGIKRYFDNNPPLARARMARNL